MPYERILGIGRLMAISKIEKSNEYWKELRIMKVRNECSLHVPVPVSVFKKKLITWQAIREVINPRIKHLS